MKICWPYTRDLHAPWIHPPPKKVYSMDDVYIFFIKPRKHAEIQKVILVMTLESSSSAKTRGTAFEFMIKVIGFWEQPCWTFSKAMLNFVFLFRVSGVCVTIERVPCILPLQREGCAGKQQGCTSEAETNSSHLTRWHPKRKGKSSKHHFFQVSC